MKKSISALLLALIVSLSCFGGFHVFAEKTAEAPARPTLIENAEPHALSEWEGGFRSVTSYLDAEAVVGKLEELAEKAGQNIEDYKAPYQAMLKTDFEAMEVEGNTIRFYDKAKEQGGKPIEESEYRYLATYSDSYEGFPFEWYAFATDNAESQHPVILILSVHEEEGLEHFHMRYGKSVDEILDMPQWFATLVNEETSDDQISALFEGMAAEMAQGEDKADGKAEEEKLPEPEVLEKVELKNWEGSWNSMASYLKEDELQDAFKKLAENEKISEEEARVGYKNRRRCEFQSLIIEGNAISFRDGKVDEKNSDVYAKADYQYKESYTMKMGSHDLLWHVFESKDDEVLYPVLLLMEVHGEGLTHFHLRYGSDAESLLRAKGWFPTFVAADSSYEQLAAEISE